MMRHDPTFSNNLPETKIPTELISINPQEKKSSAYNTFSLTSFGRQPHPKFKQDVHRQFEPPSERDGFNNQQYIGLRAKEIPLSANSTLEATQVKEIYGQLKKKSSQLNSLLDQLSKIV
jgi:hypothetical protein